MDTYLYDLEEDKTKLHKEAKQYDRTVKPEKMTLTLKKQKQKNKNKKPYKNKKCTKHNQ